MENHKPLSKEILSELGWVHKSAFFYEWPVSNTIHVDEISNRALDFRLNFVEVEKYLRIEVYERNSFEWETAFMGPCKTVGELKYLMKLFNLIEDD